MASLRSSWTNSILHTTAYIHGCKERIVISQGIGAVLLVAKLIAAELWLTVLSLPLYLIASSVHTNDKEVSQYKVRRVISLSAVAVILLVWLIKFIIILFIAFSYNPKEAFQIRETQNGVQQSVAITVQIPKAPTDNNFPIPTITEAQDVKGNITIAGKAKANSFVVATIVREGDPASPPELYAGESDKNGKFNIIEDQNTFTLPTGIYDASVVAYDAERNVKSPPSPTIRLTVHDSLLQQTLTNLDEILNISAVVFVAVALFATILTI